MEFSFAENWWQFALIALVCFVLGGVNGARLFSRSKNQDITKLGSGNPGTMNTTRVYGWKAGAAVFLFDALKGGLPTLFGYLLYKGYVFEGTAVAVSDMARYFCAAFIILGHIFPIMRGFKGGKGIASAFGAFWFGLSCESLWWILIGFGVAFIVLSFIYFTELGSLGSISGVAGCTIAQAVIFLLRYQNLPFNAYLVGVYMCLFALALLPWIAHRQNLRRLFAGEEHRTSFKKFLKKKK